MRNEILVSSFSAFRQSIESDADESTLEANGRALLTQIQRQLYSPLVAGFINNNQVIFEDVDFGEENLMISGSMNKPIVKMAVPVRHTVPRRQLDDVIRAVMDSVLPAGSITEIKVRSVKQSESEENDDSDDDDQSKWMNSTVVMRLDNAVFMDVENDEDEKDDEETAAPKVEPVATPNPETGVTSTGYTPASGSATVETTDRGTNSEARTVRETNPELPDGKTKTTTSSSTSPANTPKTLKK